MESYVFIILAGVIGFAMAFAIGANDVANAMATSVGSRVITIKQAIIIAAVFEALGASMASGQVTVTLRSGIFDVGYFDQTPVLLVCAMLAALCASFSWLGIATYYRWPVSTTHSIVGSLLGVGLVSAGYKLIHWIVLLQIFLSWLVLPVISGGLAFLIFRLTQSWIFNQQHPIQRARKLLPWYMFVVVFCMSAITLKTCTQGVGFSFSNQDVVFFCCVCAVIVSVLGYLLMRRHHRKVGIGLKQQYQIVERFFGLLAVVTACAMAFSHGSNDVANAIGPMAAVLDIVRTGQVNQGNVVPWSLAVFGAVGIVAGLAIYGYRIIESVGKGITSLTPSRSFSAQFSTALMIMISSGLGMPVSTTQTLVGAILGVGMARGIGAINLHVVRQIFMSWLITLPTGAILAVVYFYILQWLFI